MLRPAELYSRLLAPGVLADRLANERPFYLNEDQTNLESEVLNAVNFYRMTPSLIAIKSSFDSTSIEPYNTCLSVGIGIGLLTVADGKDRLSANVREKLQADDTDYFMRQRMNYKQTAKIAKQCSSELINIECVDDSIILIISALETRSTESFNPNPNRLVYSGIAKSLNVIQDLRNRVLQTF